MEFYHAFCSSGEWFLLSVLPCRTVHGRISFFRLGQSRKLVEACGPVGGDDISRGPHRIFDLDRPKIAQADGLKIAGFPGRWHQKQSFRFCIPRLSSKCSILEWLGCGQATDN